MSRAVVAVVFCNATGLISMIEPYIAEMQAPGPRVFEAWRPESRKLWGRVPLILKHRLADHALFANETLARLIETYPREHYQLMLSAQTSGGRSGDGSLDGVPGADVLDAIAKGRMWLNLRNVAAIAPPYALLMEAIFAEIRAELPDFETTARTIGIFISSPRSQTRYHADLPGQALWQIRGTKRIYLYPPIEPFISPRQLEGITLSNNEFIRYEPWYDDHARSFAMEPGDMMHWPLNTPHRIDNGDALSVSLTMEFFTRDIRRRHIVNRANAIMRLLKMQPRGTATTGLGFHAKAVLQRMLRDASFVKRRDEMRERPASWRPDPRRADAVADLPT